jgi:hypothetical protein
VDEHAAAVCHKPNVNVYRWRLGVHSGSEATGNPRVADGKLRERVLSDVREDRWFGVIRQG